MPTASHAQPTYQLQFNGHVDPSAMLPSGEVVGPYLLEGLNPVISEFQAFCIDLANPIRTNPWNARVLTFAQATDMGANQAAVEYALGSLHGGAPSWLAGLQASADLSNMFGATNALGNWDEIHYAIWTLFQSPVGAPSDLAAGNLLRTNALANVGGDYSSWRVLVDERAFDASYRAQGGLINQTFIATVPEPSTYALMGVGLLAVGFASRRRRTQA
ncbi:MAG: PEP-CTERM sorting domain-containing protein [Gemmatimonadaceae bacterium]|nr:PEP-CTERM sorting domain-containing protein [Gemmatimonadaceae bacterium]